MELCSLGHQSWLLRDSSSSVLIDPLVFGHFGRSDFLSCILNEFVSPDQWGVSIDAIFLTSHHSDHLDLPSIHWLVSRFAGIGVFVHERFPDAFIKLLKDTGADVRVVRFGDALSCGAFSIIFNRGQSSAYPWERASAGVLVAHPHGTAYIQAEASPHLLEKAVEGGVDLAVLTNNSQLRDGRRVGFLANDTAKRSARAPLDSFAGVLRDASGCLTGKSIIYTGTDFLVQVVGDPEPWHFDPVHSASTEEALQRLSNGVPVWLARAGRIWKVTPAGVEISCSDLTRNAAAVPKCSVITTSVAIDAVLEQLYGIRVPLLLSSLGRMLVNCHSYRGRALGPERLIVVLEDHGKECRLSFDVNAANFRVASEQSGEINAPYVLRAPLSAFGALLEARTEPWEFSLHPRVKQTFVGDAKTSILAFFASVFCPTVQPQRYEARSRVS